MGKRLSQLNQIEQATRENYMLLDEETFLESKKIKLKDIDIENFNTIKFYNREQVDEKFINKTNVQQTYNAESENPQSGKAVAEAIENKQNKLTAGANITIDENNVISATNGGSGGGGSITVDQTYNAESKNAQSGKAVAEAVEKKVDKLNLSKVETLDKFTNATKGLYISNSWSDGEARLAKLSYDSEPNTVACRGGDGQIPVAMYGNDNNGNFKIWKGNAIPSEFFTYWFHYYLNGDLVTLKGKTETLEEGAKLQNETIANKKITSAYNNRQLDWNSMYLLVSNTGEFDIEIRDSVSKSVVKDGDGNALPASRLCLLILPKEATKLDNNGTQGKLCMFVGITGKSINIASNFKALQFSIKNNANLYLPDICQVSTFKIGL